MIIRGFQSRDEWLAARGIGASEVAAVLGRSPWASAWDVWVRRQPGAPRQPLTPVQQEGLDLEAIVLDRYRAETGRDARRASHTVIVHEQFPWATCSPDALADGGGVELKTDRVDHGWAPESGVVVERWTPEVDDVVAPAVYLTQAYWSLECSGLPWWDLAVWLPQRWGFPVLRWVRVLRDVAHQRRMLLTVAEWRQQHLVEGVPLRVDDSEACRRWVMARPQDPAKVTRDATPDEAALMASLAWARQRRDEAVSQLRTIEAELADRMGDAYGLRASNAVVRRYNGGLHLKPTRGGR